ncbi:MAG: response regulator [Elusimicrobia bacterium]|nr:response regulator [Elusimicrobiota bacterium]
MLSILIVDDEPLINWSLGQVFEGAGYAVTLAESGEEAEALAMAGRFDVVLTDVKMKGMTGFELLRRLKAGLPGVKVVLMTAFSGEAEKDASLREGADDFIRKPFNVAEVVQRVRALLAGAECAF